MVAALVFNGMIDRAAASKQATAEMKPLDGGQGLIVATTDLGHGFQTWPS